MDKLLLDFKPWLAESRCGGRAFCATLIEGNQQIIVKSWDSYKHDSSPRDNQLSIYMKIQSLWNVCVPPPHRQRRNPFLPLPLSGICQG